MGEEFLTGVCSGGWWNPTRGGGFDRPPPLSSAAAVSCSAAVGDVGGFRWTMEMLESKARSNRETAASSLSGNSTAIFHGGQTAHASNTMAGDDFLMEPTVPMGSSGLSSPSMDWSQAFLRSSRRAEGDFHALLQDQLSSRAYLYQETSMGSDQDHMGTSNSGNPFKGFNQGFMADQPHLSSGDISGGGGGNGAFHGDSLACSSALLHGLLHQDMKSQDSYFDTCPTNFMSPEDFPLSTDEPPRIPQFLKSSSPKQQLQASGRLQFSNDTHFWNAVGGSGDGVGSNFSSPRETDDQVFTQQAFEEKPCLSTTRRKSSSEATRDSNSAATATAGKKSASEPAFKKPRIETPSPLPTFKVRKEKLGDRITALQQLVSPFGKTDTASVLHEAIEYIKFLHEQVGVLTRPYLKNGSPVHYQQNSDKSKDDDGPKQSLKSRGLCLVPIPLTFPVVDEPAADFWNPTFGGTYCR